MLLWRLCCSARNFQMGPRRFLGTPVNRNGDGDNVNNNYTAYLILMVHVICVSQVRENLYKKKSQNFILTPLVSMCKIHSKNKASYQEFMQAHTHTHTHTDKALTHTSMHNTSMHNTQNNVILF